MDDKMDQYSQLSKEFDRVGLTDLLEAYPWRGIGFMLLSTYLHRVK